jgi:ABC-type antimicrobial peptide transport system permease subunit
MGGIFSSAESTSIVDAQGLITQQYSGECDISCTNAIGNVSIDLENTYFSEFDITQSCNVNAQCSIDSNATALSDILAKAKSQTDVSGNIPLWNALVSESKTSSIIDIKQQILQSTQEKCHFKSANEIGDLKLNSNNSSMNKVSVDQLGNVTGGCTLSNLLEASALASGISESESRNGKQKKGPKGKKFSTFGLIIFLIIAVIVVFLIFRTLANSPELQQNAVKLATIAAV